MKTVELSAALNSAQVVENLKNFVGVDAQGAAALMTPERLAAVAGESFSKPYSNDLNSELDYCTTGMFNKDTQNVPSEINHVGLFTNFRAKFNEGVFMFQILIPMVHPFLYVRVHWNQTWYNWKRVALG